MRKIQIISRKFDGTLRDEYQAFLYAEDRATFRVYAPPGTPSFDHRKGQWLRSPDGVIEIYFKAKWCIVWHICEQQSRRNLIYTHIAMPAALTDDRLEWVDLDLDYRVHPDGAIERLDVEEFEYNVRALSYPAEVITEARLACQEVEHLYQARVFPFNHEEQVAVYQALKAGHEIAAHKDSS